MDAILDHLIVDLLSGSVTENYQVRKSKEEVAPQKRRSKEKDKFATNLKKLLKFTIFLMRRFWRLIKKIVNKQ